MSLLQRTGQVIEADENLLVVKHPDDVKLSGTAKVANAGIAALGIAGIIISITTLVSALLH